MSDLVKTRTVTLSSPGEAEIGSAEVQPIEEYPGVRCAEGARWLVVDFKLAASCLMHHPTGRENHRTSDRCLENLCIESASGVDHQVGR